MPNGMIDVFAPMHEAIDARMHEQHDVSVAIDDGGAASVQHAPRSSAMRGRVVKGVPVIDLAIVRTGSVQLIAEIGRDLEANGDKPCVKFSRDHNGNIDGVLICSAVELGEVA